MGLLDMPLGIYRGVVDGREGGHCTARIEVRAAPGGCLTVDYEAASDEFGLQHVEHALVSTDALHVAFGEGHGVAVFVATGPVVYQAAAEPRMQIVASFNDSELSWGWHWSTDGSASVEQSRARCRLAAC